MKFSIKDIIYLNNFEIEKIIDICGEKTLLIAASEESMEIRKRITETLSVEKLTFIINEIFYQDKIKSKDVITHKEEVEQILNQLVFEKQISLENKENINEKKLARIQELNLDTYEDIWELICLVYFEVQEDITKLKSYEGKSNNQLINEVFSVLFKGLNHTFFDLYFESVINDYLHDKGLKLHMLKTGFSAVALAHPISDIELMFKNRVPDFKGKSVVDILADYE